MTRPNNTTIYRPCNKKETDTVICFQKKTKFAAGFQKSAEIAQLVEQRIRNAWVGGSSPPLGSINKQRPHGRCFFIEPGGGTLSHCLFNQKI